jgi:hypothetical protein
MKGSYKLQALSFKQNPFAFIVMTANPFHLFFKPIEIKNFELGAHSLKLRATL